MTAESAGLIQPCTATLHTEACSIDLISGRSNRALRQLPDGVRNFPVAIDENGGLVRVSQCGDSRILSDSNLQRGDTPGMSLRKDGASSPTGVIAEIRQ